MPATAPAPATQMHPDRSGMKAKGRIRIKSRPYRFIATLLNLRLVTNPAAAHRCDGVTHGAA
jgi:hypothetical protein